MAYMEECVFIHHENLEDFPYYITIGIIHYYLKLVDGRAQL